jgi:hypothetical protein
LTRQSAKQSTMLKISNQGEVSILKTDTPKRASASISRIRYSGTAHPCVDLTGAIFAHHQKITASLDDLSKTIGNDAPDHFFRKHAARPTNSPMQ